MQEIAVSLIPQEEVAFLREKEDKKFFDFITNELSKAISERLIQVLETNDEIIIKKPVLRISEYGPLDSVEYKKIVDWKPLIRCKDCKYYNLKIIIARVLGTGLERKTRGVIMDFVTKVKGKKTMSRYGRSDYDDMIYELDEFLHDHTIVELLQLVARAAEDKEYWEKENE